MQTYIGNMQDLLLHHGLSDFKPGGAVYQVAKEQTIFTLGRLDAPHNKIVLQFLQNASLADALDLSNSDLGNDLLNNADLSGIGLIGTTLTSADLSSADLSDATMYGADLSGAHLSKATITGASLSDAALTGADLRGAYLSNATFVDADLTDAQLNGATLTAVRLTSAHLSHANLSRADLSGADLTSADLTGAILTRADLSGANLTGATLTKANLSGANLTGATLTKANLSGAKLTGINLSGAKLTGINLSGTKLTGINLTGADRSDLRNASSATPLNSDQAPSCPNEASPNMVKHPITLTYWYTESGSEACAMLEQINQFEWQHPNIKINAMQRPFFQTRAALTTAVRQDTAPDVWRSDVGWTTWFASKGYLLNIDSYITQSDLSDYKSAPLGVALTYDEYNGHLYGLPQVADFLALLYNKNELKKAGITHPPATMTELENDAITVVQRKKLDHAKYGFETSGTSYYALPFLYAYGGGMFDGHNNIVVNSSGSVKGLQFLVNMENTGAMPSNTDFNEDNALTNMRTDFMNGRTAMIFDGPFDISQILTGYSFNHNNRNLGIAAIPTGPGGQTGSPLGGQSYVISASTTHPYEAYQFISFMSSGASQVKIAEANDTLPTRQSAYQDRKISGDSFISAFLKIKETAVARPAIPQGRYLFDMFDPSIWAALVGVQSPNDALNTVADDWKQLGAGK